MGVPNLKIDMKRIIIGVLIVLLSAIVTNVTLQVIYSYRHDGKVIIDAYSGPKGLEYAKNAGEVSESKPPAEMLDTYTVDPDLPRALYIDKIGVKASILPMGLNANKTIQTPKNIYDAGWYTASAKPGEPGAAFISGYAAGPTNPGLLERLHELVVGDKILVQLGSNVILNYRVVYTATEDVDNVSMKQMLEPYKAVQKGLNLMTCSSSLASANTRADVSMRVEVFAVQVD